MEPKNGRHNRTIDRMIDSTRDTTKINKTLKTKHTLETLIIKLTTIIIVYQRITDVQHPFKTQADSRSAFYMSVFVYRRSLSACGSIIVLLRLFNSNSICIPPYRQWRWLSLSHTHTQSVWPVTMAVGLSQALSLCLSTTERALLSGQPSHTRRRRSSVCLGVCGHWLINLVH